jgi:hypothetical protein
MFYGEFLKLIVLYYPCNIHISGKQPLLDDGQFRKVKTLSGLQAKQQCLYYIEYTFMLCLQLTK